MGTCRCAYQGVRNVSFSQNFAGEMAIPNSPDSEAAVPRCS